YFLSPSTAITGTRSGWGRDAVAGAISCNAMSGTPLSIESFGVPAGGPMSGALLLVGRELRSTPVVGEGAARRESATGRKIAQCRHHPGDFLQPLRGIGTSAHNREARNRGQ